MFLIGPVSSWLPPLLWPLCPLIVITFTPYCDHFDPLLWSLWPPILTTFPAFLPMFLTKQWQQQEWQEGDEARRRILREIWNPMLYSNVCACKITTILHSEKYKPTKNVFILKIIFCFNQTVQQMQAAWFRQLQNVRVRKVSAKPAPLCITPSPWCPLIPPYISPISPK